MASKSQSPANLTKKLEIDVRSRQEQLSNVKVQSNTHKSRAGILTNHLNNVKQDLNLTVQLLASKKRSEESEKHQKMVSDREYGRLKQEILRIKTGLEENHQKQVTFENNVNFCKDKIGELKETISWDQKKLEHWLEESSKQDDNVLTLHKYMKEDDSKLKQLMLTMERLTDEVRKARKILDSEKTETQTIQIEVDKTAEDFRKQQDEREVLIQQWKNTISQMQKRDEDINSLSETIGEEAELLQHDKNEIIEKQAFFDNEKQNNSEIDRNIDQRTRENAKLLDILQVTEQERSQIDSELQTAHFSVERVTNDLETCKATSRQLAQNIIDKENKLELQKQQIEVTKNNLAQAEGEQLTAEQKAAAAERLLHHEEQIIKNLMEQAKTAREIQFKRQKELKKAKDESIVLTNAIDGDTSAIHNLKRRLKQLDDQNLKQEEVVYQQGFQMVNLDRRLSKLQGEGMDVEEKEKLENKIKDLNTNLENKQNNEKVVNQQLKKLKEEIRRVGQDMDRTDIEFTDLESKISEMDLQYESAQRELGKLEKESNSSLVDDNLLRLGISRLRGTLAERVSTVTDLSQRRIQLDSAIKERKIQIGHMRNLVSAELKAAEGERSVLSHDLYERINKIEKIRNRYDSLMVLMAPPDSEPRSNSDEDTNSQAHYVIKAAQDKEELQRYGDKLDQDIKKAEAENEALVNTVRVVRAKNRKLHEALSPMNPESMNESKELEKASKACLEKLKLRKTQYRELESNIQEIMKAIENQSFNDFDLQNKFAIFAKELESVDKQITSQKVKKDRAERGVRKFNRRKFSEIQNMSLDLKEFRSLITGAGRQLGQILRPYEEISTIAGSMMIQCGINADQILARSSTTLSKTSSMSSLSSSKTVTPQSTSRLNTADTLPEQTALQNLSISTARPPSVASTTSSNVSSTASRRQIPKSNRTIRSAQPSNRATDRSLPSTRASTARSNSSRSSNASGLSLSGSKIGK